MKTKQTYDKETSLTPAEWLKILLLDRIIATDGSVEAFCLWTGISMAAMERNINRLDTQHIFRTYVFKRAGLRIQMEVVYDVEEI
jgi:hypothetical protein